MKNYGRIDYARSLARNLAGAALAEFDEAYRDAKQGEPKGFIRDLVRYMIERRL
jgi:hypothetical protein